MQRLPFFHHGEDAQDNKEEVENVQINGNGGINGIIGSVGESQGSIPIINNVAAK